jgi:hypothetical protein
MVLVMLYSQCSWFRVDRSYMASVRSDAIMVAHKGMAIGNHETETSIVCSNR